MSESISVDRRCSENKSSYRSSHQRCSIKKAVHKNFTKFTEKHLCRSLFFKVAGLNTFHTKHLRVTSSETMVAGSPHSLIPSNGRKNLEGFFALYLGEKSVFRKK